MGTNQLADLAEKVRQSGAEETESRRAPIPGRLSRTLCRPMGLDYSLLRSPSGRHLGGFIIHKATMSIACLCICSFFILGMRAPRMLRVPQIAALYPEVYDFGTVFQAETISHRFSLSNQSDRVLCVVAIKTSCSCRTCRGHPARKDHSPQRRFDDPS